MTGAKLLIADSQVHVWAADTPERPWQAGYQPHRAIPLGPSQLLQEMDAVGVHRAVLVPSALENNRNDLALEGARQHPSRFAVMGRLDLGAPSARIQIGSWCHPPGMVGLRCSFLESRWATEFRTGRLDWLWEEAEKAGVPVMLMMTHELLPFIESVAARHPALKVALDHLALDSSKRDEEAFCHLDELLELARRPNIMVKVSALPAYTRDRYPFRRLHPYVRRVYDAFGPKRMFWGTDLSRLTCSYREAITMFTEEMSWLTTEDKEWIMGRGLCEWLKWHPLQA